MSALNHTHPPKCLPPERETQKTRAGHFLLGESIANVSGAEVDLKSKNHSHAGRKPKLVRTMTSKEFTEYRQHKTRGLSKLIVRSRDRDNLIELSSLFPSCGLSGLVESTFFCRAISQAPD